MEYKLNEVRPGEFEVVRSMPVVVGTFADPDIARKFMLFLAEEEADAELEGTQPAANADAQPAIAEPSLPAAQDPAAAADEQPKLHRAPYAPAVKLPDEKPKADPVPVPVSDEAWTDDELQSAFDMLSKGEALRVVADRHGKSWTKLRAKWAHRKKHIENASSTALVPVVTPSKTPLEKVTSAVSELAAQEECRICKRHFKPTTDNLDLCARCSHGA